MLLRNTGCNQNLLVLRRQGVGPGLQHSGPGTTLPPVCSNTDKFWLHPEHVEASLKAEAHDYIEQVLSKVEEDRLASEVRTLLNLQIVGSSSLVGGVRAAIADVPAE